MKSEAPVLNEPQGHYIGFKRLYPNLYSELVDLPRKIIEHPKTKEEAKHNKTIHLKLNEIKKKLRMPIDDI